MNYSHIKVSQQLMEKPPGYTYIMIFSILFYLSYEICSQILIAFIANTVKEA